MTQAIKTQGTVLSVDISTTLTPILEPVSISPVGESTNLIDATNLSSTAREYIGGLKDGSEVTIQCNYVQNDPGQEYVRDQLEQTETFQLTLSNGDTADFDAVVLAHNVGPFGVEDKTMVEFRIKITGGVTWTEV